MSQPIVDIAHTAKSACQTLLLFFCGVKAVLVRTFLQHLLLAFLGLDIALDGLERHAPNRATIVGVGPQRRQFLLEVRKLLPQLVSRCPLDVLHQAVNAEVRITAHQQMDVVGHHFHLNKGLPPSLNDLGDQLLESCVDPLDEHFAPILGTKDDMVMAIIDNISIALNYCLHAQIVAENSRYVNSTYWSGSPTPRPKRNSPHIPTPGRAAVLRAGLITRPEFFLLFLEARKTRAWL